MKLTPENIQALKNFGLGILATLIISGILFLIPRLPAIIVALRFPEQISTLEIKTSSEIIKK